MPHIVLLRTYKYMFIEDAKGCAVYDSQRCHRLSKSPNKLLIHIHKNDVSGPQRPVIKISYSCFLYLLGPFTLSIVFCRHTKQLFILCVIII